MIALYLFPVLVVLLTTLSFMAGGAVSVWQWWAAFAIAVGIGFFRRPWREGVRGMVILFCAMLATCMLSGMMIAPGWRDEVWCHLPAVRLLAAGWNPLEVRAPEAFQSAYGFGLSDMKLLHVLFQPKAVWIFNAVAGSFTRDFLCPMLPILVFLFSVTLVEVWHGLKSSVGHRALAAVVLYAVIPTLACAVDAVVALAAIGLLMSMWSAIARKGVRPLSLTVFTFWLCAAKGSGIAQAAVYWSVFVVVVLCRRLPSRQVIGSLAVSLALALTVCFSPFVTSWVDYGHPLYPNRTADAEKFPAVDLLADFLTDRNDDAREMGYWGTFVYAYVSPALSNAYYARKTGRPDFQAKRSVNKHYPTDCQDQTFAVDPSVRIVFWICIAILSVWGSAAGRMVSGMVLLSLLAVPYPLFGYLRYAPQFFCPLVFVTVLAGNLECRVPRLVLLSSVCLSLCAVHPYNLARQLVDTAANIRERAALEWLLAGGRGNLPSEVFYPTKYSKAFVSLCFRDHEVLSKVAVRGLPDGQRSFRHYRALTRAPGSLFRYRGDSVFREYEQSTRIFPPEGGVCARWLYVFKTFLVVAPRLAI